MRWEIDDLVKRCLIYVGGIQYLETALRLTRSNIIHDCGCKIPEHRSQERNFVRVRSRIDGVRRNLSHRMPVLCLKLTNRPRIVERHPMVIDKSRTRRLPVVWEIPPLDF